MANFKVKNHFKAERVKLVDATAYQCCFCDLSEFKCQHAMNDWQKTKAAMKFIEE